MKTISLGYLKKGKRGNIVLDCLLIIVVLFALFLIGLTAQNIMTNVNTAIQASGQVTTEGKASLATNAAQSASVFDGIYITAFVLMWGLLLIGSYNVKTSPAIFALFLVIFAVIVFVGLILANAANDVAADSQLYTYAQQMPKMLFIIQNMNLVLVFVIASVAITLWGKNIFDKSPY